MGLYFTFYFFAILWLFMGQAVAAVCILRHDMPWGAAMLLAFPYIGIGLAIARGFFLL